MQTALPSPVSCRLLGWSARVTTFVQTGMCWPLLSMRAYLHIGEKGRSGRWSLVAAVAGRMAAAEGYWYLR